MVLFLSTFYELRTIFHKVIELTHSTIFYSQKKEQNRTTKKFNYEIVPMYIKDLYIWFLVLIEICIVTFSDVRTKLNDHILQRSDLKCTYEIEPFRIDCYILQSSGVIFSKCDRFLIILALKSHSMISVRNLSITLYNNVMWKRTFEINTERN